MKLRFIFPYYFILVGVSSSILPSDFYAETKKPRDAELTNAIKNILNTWASHDVILVVANYTRNVNVDRVGDRIADVSVSSHPTQLFKTAEIYKIRLKELEMATSRTLLFYVYCPLEPNEDVNYMTARLFYAIQPKHSPKIVLVLVVDTERVDVAEPVDIMFNYGYPSTVGLEVLAKEDGSLLPTYVHRYNIATKNSSRLTYDGNVSDWYTDRYQNLMGLPLQLCKSHVGASTFDKLSEVQWDVIREKMNVTFSLDHKGISACVLSYDPRYMIYTQYSIGNVGYSVPLYIDKVCLFIPNIVQESTMMTWGLSIAVLLGIVIVVFILGFSMLTRIGTFDRPFHIIAVILGTSVDPMRLSSLTEKILYLCLVQVATRYMTMLYSELFSDTLGQKEVKINDFEDLYGLNLKIMLNHEMHYLYAESTDTIVPPELLPMFERNIDTENSTAYEGNVGYFSIRLVELYRRWQLPTWPKKKRSDLCIGTATVVLQMVPGAWLRDRVNDLLLQINQYGIEEHVTESNYKWVGGQDVEVEQQIDDGISIQKRMVMALLCSYVLAVIIFLGELLVAWIRSRKLVNAVLEITS